jgi:hypothetical protein
MAGLQATISYGCDTNGQGYIQINSYSIINQGTAYVTINSVPSGGASYAPAFPPTTTPYKMFVPTGVYAIEIWQNGTRGTIKIGGSTLPTQEVEIDCFVCDVSLNTVTTTKANAPVANGTATLTASGLKSTKQYSINGSTWQTSNYFSGIAVGNYTAYVRYQAYPNCISTKPFSILAAPVYGCTNPAADNYNPAANTDNGTCVFITQYFATGGTMPNPIYIEKTYTTTTGFPIRAKTRHYITLNLYLGGSTILIAKRIARVRNGKIKMDISKDLQRGILNLSVGNGLITNDAEAIFPFEIGFVESYDGVSYAESRSPYPKRNAIRAALPKATDTITANVLMQLPVGETPQAEFLSAFDVPVKFPEEPVCLAMVIDELAYQKGQTYNPLYLERSYYDVHKRLVQRISSQVFQTGFVRFEINDPVLFCVSYMEVCLNTDFREQAADCFEGEAEIPPQVLPNMVQIRDGSGNVVADVPTGSAFVIESGFSFGFGIVEGS